MRKLNLALVDIGAGTSDVAITDGGTVIGYGMVPEAGDEITDIICDHYLVDFKEGEKIKRSLLPGKTMEIADIFGTTAAVPSSDVIAVIENNVDEITEKIANVILSLNEKTPRAVVCVGGGSQTALLKERLAHHLGIPPQRVGMRLPGAIDRILDNTGHVTGVDMITPLGIALTAYQDMGIEFMDIVVNDGTVHMMDINGLTVMDALVAAKIKRIYARPGLALSLNVNSSFMIIKGGFGRHAEITLNGKKAKLGDPLHSGDTITFMPPVDGGDAHLRTLELAQRLDMSPVNISLNGTQPVQYPVIVVNGSRAGPQDIVPDRAVVDIRPATLEDAACSLDMGENKDKLVVMVNNVATYLDKTRCTIKVNGRSVNTGKIQDYVLSDDDNVTIEKKDIGYTIQDIIELPEDGNSVNIIVNDREITFNGSEGSVTINGQKALLSTRVHDSDVILVKDGKDAKPILSDVFEVMDIKREELVGKTIRMYVDRVPARFTTPLTDGCRISIEFVEV